MVVLRSVGETGFVRWTWNPAARLRADILLRSVSTEGDAGNLCPCLAVAASDRLRCHPAIRCR